ncbi:DUF6370 family protein [Ferruginibacter sp. SUN002]|uniref:DUF6370 family protein n=1 Tax=Ferruginibacter sp. SUN002 TaxID=2937789 RepID=UPI003D36D57D
MKFFIGLLFCLSGFTTFGQTGIASTPDTLKQLIKAEVSCGQCKFGLPGKGCSLAVRIKGKAYFVDGTSIDEHGDAHAADGFCNAVRHALIQGKVVRKRFKVTYFKLID